MTAQVSPSLKTNEWKFAPDKGFQLAIKSATIATIVKVYTLNPNVTVNLFFLEFDKSTSYSPKRL
jgi:hypothetical protein